MNWGDIGGHLFATLVGAGVIGFSAFFLWLWKRSVYGRLDGIDKTMGEFKREFGIQLNEAKLLAERNVEEAKRLAAEGLAQLRADSADTRMLATTGIHELKDALQTEIREVKKEYVPLMFCNSERDGCQALLLQKITSVGIILGNKMDALTDSHNKMMKRVDAHLNGHSSITRMNDGQR